MQSDPGAVFAARGWLTEHPAAFRSLLMKEGVPVDMRVGTCVFRRDDESNGLYGILSGAIGIEGGHRLQSPLMMHVLRTGEWFGIKAVFLGGPRELTYRALEPTRLSADPAVEDFPADADECRCRDAGGPAGRTCDPPWVMDCARSADTGCGAASGLGAVPGSGGG